MIGKNMEQHHERRNKTPLLLSEAELSSIVEAEGGRYVGVQIELQGGTGTVHPVHLATNKNNIGHADFAFNRRGGTRGTGGIRRGLQRSRFEMKNATGTGVKLAPASRDFFSCRNLETSNFPQRQAPRDRRDALRAEANSIGTLPGKRQDPHKKWSFI